jgi:hypothetical protein
MSLSGPRTLIQMISFRPIGIRSAVEKSICFDTAAIGVSPRGLIA